MRTAAAPLTTKTTMTASADLPDAPSPVGTSSASFDPQTASSSQTPTTTQTTPPTTTPVPAPDQVKKQTKQRVLGVLPNFNVSYASNAAPLTPHQKLKLAFRSSIDPFQFASAAVLALYGQATDQFGPEYETDRNSAGVKVRVRYEGYGQGVGGYAKRFGATYADNFDGTMIGNAFLPILLKEDPRYFRMGTGTIKKRILYSIRTSVWCKRDNGTWGPNYANVIGNLAAGGISNIYYPSEDRGAGLTITRGLTVTAEGALGGLANEFLPDLTRHFLHREVSGRRVNGTAGSTPTPAPPPAPPDEPGQAPPQ